MTWVKRGLWLAAWGAWGWLGVGLYRELPRTPGRAVHQLWNQAATLPLGFIGSSDLIAAYRPDPDHAGFTLVDVYDARDGRLRHSVAGPAIREIERNQAIVQQVAAGVLIDTFGPYDGVADGLRVLSLADGAWRTFGGGRVKHISLHPRKPLVVFSTAVGPFDDRVRVVNVKSGERLFDYRIPNGTKLGFSSFFIMDDRIVLPTRKESSEDFHTLAFEIWSLGHHAKLLKTISGPALDASANVSANGRIARSGRIDRHIFEVFDVERGEVVFVHPQAETPVTSRSARSEAPVIALSGRTIIGGDRRSLWNVECSAEVWRPGPWEHPSPFPYADDFDVIENWSALWSKWLPKLRFQTVARRSFETGEFLWRTTFASPLVPHFCNESRTLAVTRWGMVRELPLVVNYSLLALCQTILALPLIFFWLALLWRRKRRERRLAGATA